MEMNTNPNSIARNRKQRSGPARFFIGLFKLLFLLVAIAAGLFLGWFGWQQLSFYNTVNDVQNRRISRLDAEIVRQNEVEQLVREAVGPLRNEIAGLNTAVSRLSEANTALQETVEAQAAEIGALRSTQEETAGGIAALGTDIETLSSGLLALQSDIAANSGDVDDIGSAIDDLLNDFDALQEKVTELEAGVVVSPTTALDEGTPGVTLSTAAGNPLAVWRLWGLVVRTKLHLAENDITAATASLTEAQAAADALVEGAAAGQADALTEIQTAIDSAADSITGKPAVANRTLDDVLNALDALLAP